MELGNRSYLFLGPPERLEPLLEAVPNVDRLLLDANELKVEQLRRTLALAVQGGFSARRLLLITDAQMLSEIAQNTLLHLLEEPSRGLVIILQATRSVGLLPTVRSRLEPLKVSEIIASEAGPELKTAWESLHGLLRQSVPPARPELLRVLSQVREALSREILSTPEGAAIARHDLIERAIFRLEKNSNVKLVADWLLLHNLLESGNRKIAC